MRAGPAQVLEVLDAGGELPLTAAVVAAVSDRRGSRYVGDLRSPLLQRKAPANPFQNDIFHRYHGRFGIRRKDGARPMTGGSPELCTARRLRLSVITMPMNC